MEGQAPPIPTSLGFIAPPNLEQMLAIFVTIVFIWWVIFTVVVIYHWLRFARDSWFTVPILVFHFFISGLIMVFALGGFNV